MKKSNEELVLGLDVSTSCIGIALFEIKTNKLVLLTHVSPKLKDAGEHQIEDLIKKSQIFENDFLKKYANSNITKVIIEQPLAGSNNLNTIITLIRFNTLISKSIYEILGVVPEYISSYDSRKIGFPELMQIRNSDGSGKLLSEKELKNKKPVLFGGYPKNVDKKLVVLECVSNLYPYVIWLYDKHQQLRKESFDLSDAACCVIAYLKKNELWINN